MNYVFATNNKGKIKEINALFAGAGLYALSPADFNLSFDIKETGSTYAENALLKAKNCFDLLRGKGIRGAAVLADDSGLEIDALDGRPGVYSARFMGEDTAYDQKNQRIIEMLAGVPDIKRSARFICVIACVLPNGKILETKGTVEGRIAHEPKGGNGFGYDPVFIIPAYDMTSAELSPEIKNRVSHRGQALLKMLELLSKETNGNAKP